MKLESILNYGIKFVLTAGAFYLVYKSVQDYKLKEEREKVYETDNPLFT